MQLENLVRKEILNLAPYRVESATISPPSDSIIKLDLNENVTIPQEIIKNLSRELWENGCLVNINSTTDDNGDDYYISSKKLSAELALETQNGSTSLNGSMYRVVGQVKEKGIIP